MPGAAGSSHRHGTWSTVGAQRERARRAPGGCCASTTAATGPARPARALRARRPRRGRARAARPTTAWSGPRSAGCRSAGWWGCGWPRTPPSASSASCCAAPRAAWTPEPWRDRAAAVRALGTVSIAEAVVARWFTPAFAAREPVVVRADAAMSRPPHDEGYAGCCEAIARDGPRPLRPRSPRPRSWWPARRIWPSRPRTASDRRGDPRRAAARWCPSGAPRPVVGAGRGHPAIVHHPT